MKPNTLIFLITAAALCHSGHVHAQSLLGDGTRPFVGRVSVGWNYYSQDSSLAPELSSMTNTYNFGYRFFNRETDRIRYRFQVDFYQKNSFAAPTKSRFDNRYIFRQLYFSHGDKQEIKAGKVIPMNAVVDAHPINGVSIEDVAFHSFEFTAFGGTINDFYDNTFMGSGYNFGGAASYKKPNYTVGAGFSSEKFNRLTFSKAYLYAWYQPVNSLQVSNKSQYMLNRSMLGYSQTNVIYRGGRRLTIRLSGEYHDRSSQYIAPTDTLHSPDKYFYTSREKTVSAHVIVQTFQKPAIGSLSITTSVKKRIGNGDLFYGGMRILYQNYFYYTFQTGLNASYTSNQWLKLVRLGGSLGRGFFKEKLDVSLAFSQSIFSWNALRSSHNQATSSKSLSSVSADIYYRFSRAMNASVSVTEEFGSAFDPRMSAWVRVSYSLR